MPSQPNSKTKTIHFGNSNGVDYTFDIKYNITVLTTVSFTMLEILIIFITGFILGWLSHARSIFQKIFDNPDRMIHLLEKYKEAKEEAEEESLPVKMTEVRVEKIGEQFYLYTTKDNEFLAQGISLEAALEAVKQRYPNRIFRGLIAKEDAEKMGLSKQN